MCESCKQELHAIIEQRIRRILALAHEESSRPLGGPEPDEIDEVGIAQAQCFHLMELQRILEGNPTCGVFDDYGATPAPTVQGPLFS